MLGLFEFTAPEYIYDTGFVQLVFEIWSSGSGRREMAMPCLIGTNSDLKLRSAPSAQSFVREHKKDDSEIGNRNEQTEIYQNRSRSAPQL